MTLVLDVSAAIQIILKKEKMELFSNVYRNAAWVIAPELYIAEITNVLWKYETILKTSVFRIVPLKSQFL